MDKDGRYAAAERYAIGPFSPIVIPKGNTMAPSVANLYGPYLMNRFLFIEKSGPGLGDGCSRHLKNAFDSRLGNCTMFTRACISEKIGPLGENLAYRWDQTYEWNRTHKGDQTGGDVDQDEQDN